MFLKDISPFIRQAVIGNVSNTIQNQGTHKRLKSSYHRLFYIIDGEGTIIVEGNNYILRPGSAIIINSGTEYIWDIEDAQVIAVSFDYTDDFIKIPTPTFAVRRAENFDSSSIIERVVFKDAQSLNTPVYVLNASSIEYNLRAIPSLYLLKESFTQELLSCHMKLVITTLVQKLHSNNNTTKDSDTIRRIINYIQTNYSKNITNSHIAEAFHFSYSYINKIFRQNTGISIHKYLLDYRMDIAKELLRNQNASVASIALSVGYTDPHNFLKFFKKATGKTPTEYRTGM